MNEYLVYTIGPHIISLSADDYREREGAIVFFYEVAGIRRTVATFYRVRVCAIVKVETNEPQ